jgi:predicted 3-demethylubiquinone-9 3-methyltransferase (glyoxalase superfamily)
MKTISPFLWFDHQAEEAAKFYVSLFPNSRIVQTARYGEAGPGPKGSVMTVNFELNGQSFVALNGGPHFQFSEAISFVVPCESQDEIDRYWEALSKGGAPGQCGWLKDRYGLSWQIVPAAMGELMTDADPKRSAAVMAALLEMTKLDIAELRRARERA